MTDQIRPAHGAGASRAVIFQKYAGLCAVLLSGTVLSTGLPGKAFAQETTVLEEIAVSNGGQDPLGGGDGYVAPTTTTGSKTATDIKDIPQSVSVVTRKQIDDRQPAQLEDVLAYTPGVATSIWGTDDRFDQFLIRGFDIGTSGIFRDGLSQKVINFSSFKVEPYGAERVEVLKGPGGVLYGENDAGGLVNVITKRPVFDPLYAGFLSYGSFDTFEAGADVGGALNVERTMAFRLTGLVRQGSTEVDGAENDRYFIAPSFTWKPNDQTSLTILTHYQSDKLTPNSFLPVAGLSYDASLGSLPDSFIFSQSDFNKFDTENGAVGYEFEHAFTDALTFRQKLRYAAQKTDYQHLYYNGMASATEMAYVAFTVDEFATIFNVDNQLQYDANFSGVENTLLVGADYTRHQVDGENGYGGNYLISVTNPNYNFTVTDPAIYYKGVQTIDRVGLYAQNQSRIFDNWLLTLGGRQSWLNNSFEDELYGSDTSQFDTNFSGFAGLGYDFANGITPYASYSESFVSNVGSTFSGELYKPSEARQFEAGIKYRPTFFNGFFTVAVFDITKTNVLTSDPVNTGFNVQTGEVNHRGVELEANVSLGSGLSLTGGYTYLDAEITKSNDGDQGNRPGLVPEHQASLWANYQVQEGLLEGVSFGAGVRYIGESFGDTANTVKVDSYTLVDAALRYERENFGLSFNVNNVFDKTYYATCNGSSSCILGEGRTFKAMLTAKF